MSDPRRLLEDPNAAPEVTGLLRSIDAPTPLEPAIRAEIGARLSKSVLLAPVATKLVALKAGLGAAVVAGGAAFYFAVQPAPAPAPAPQRNAAPASPAVPAAPVVPDTAPAERDVPPEPAPKRAVESSPDSVRSTSRRDTLALEESLLEQARRASAASPARALTLLHEHARRFPNGELTAERLYLTAQAHARAGNSTAARHYARLLADRFPRSTYLPRVQPLLAGGAPAASAPQAR